MIPQNTVKDLISRHSALEKELSSGEIEKKKFAEKSKEYSDLNEIIELAKRYISFEKEAEQFGQKNWKKWYNKFKKEGLF